MKLFFLVNYIKLNHQNYSQRRFDWIENIRRHLAARRIAIHWNRFMFKKSSCLVFRWCMTVRHCFKYHVRCQSYKPSFSGNVLWIFQNFLFKRATRNEFHHKLVKYAAAANRIQNNLRNAFDVRMYRISVLSQYWIKVRETINFIYNLPKYNKRLKDTIIEKICSDDSGKSIFL